MKTKANLAKFKNAEKEANKEIQELMQKVASLRNYKRDIGIEKREIEKAVLHDLASTFCNEMQKGITEYYEYNQLKTGFTLPSNDLNNGHRDLRANFLEAWHEMNAYIAEQAAKNPENFIQWVVDSGSVK